MLLIIVALSFTTYLASRISKLFYDHTRLGFYSRSFLIDMIVSMHHVCYLSCNPFVISLVRYVSLLYHYANRLLAFISRSVSKLWLLWPLYRLGTPHVWPPLCDTTNVAQLNCRLIDYGSSPLWFRMSTRAFRLRQSTLNVIARILRLMFAFGRLR